MLTHGFAFPAEGVHVIYKQPKGFCNVSICTGFVTISLNTKCSEKFVSLFNEFTSLKLQQAARSHVSERSPYRRNTALVVGGFSDRPD